LNAAAARQSTGRAAIHARLRDGAARNMSTRLETVQDHEVARLQPTLVPGLVHGFRIQADGAAEELPPDFAFDAGVGRGPGWYWLHLNLADARAGAWLETLVDVPAKARSFIRAHHDHQQLNASPGCVFGVIADLERGLERSLDRTGYLNFALTERLVISGRRQPLQAVGRLREAIGDGRRITTAAALVDALVDHVADGVDELVERLIVDIDRIEDLVLGEEPADERRQLGQLRRTGVRLHRQLAGLRTLFHRFERSGRGDLNQNLRLSVGQFAQRLDALDHEVVAIQERARLLQEEIAAKLAEESNRHLHTLSIITALFLPPTLIFGMFGMNTHDLPLVQTPLGTLWAVAIALGAALLVYWWLRRWRGIR
jgi:zinc transporter